MNRKLVLILTLTLLIGMLNVAFNVQPVKSDYVWTETIYIRADGSIDPSTAPISSFDNVTYTLTDNITNVPYDSSAIDIQRDNIVLDGAGYTVTGNGNGNGNGTTLTDRKNVTLRNMTTRNFYTGIVLSDSSGNTLSGNNVANSWYGIWLDSSSGNTLSGNNVAHSSYGIWLDSSSGNTLSGNNVTANNYHGIWLDSSSGNTLSGNNVTANDWGGIGLVYSSNNVLSGNNVTANNGDGIRLDSSSGNTLSGNVMAGNRYNFGISGSAFIDYLNSVETSNLVDGKPVYYFINQSDIVVDADVYPEVGYLGFVNCANVTVQGLTLAGNGQGLLLLFTNDSKITGNNLANNRDDGIVLGYSSGNTLSGNNVTGRANNGNGIVLNYSSGNTLSGNNVANSWYGIRLGYSSGNTLSGNNVAHSSYGIWLDSSSGNTLSGNNVTANDWAGIVLGYSSGNTLSGNVMVGSRFFNFGVYGDVLSDFLQSVDTSNLVDGKPVYYFVNQSDLVVNAAAYPEVGYLGFVNCANVTVQGLTLAGNGQGLLLAFTNDSKITGNNLANNSCGIMLVSSSGNTLSGNNVAHSFWYGIRLVSSSNNSVFHNSFVNGPTHQVYTKGSNNIWDGSFPLGGNYWSDYTGTDANHDGIGDTPYIIDANNTDHYPLMIPYVIPEFPSFLILPLFFIATLLAVIVHRRKHRQTKRVE